MDDVMDDAPPIGATNVGSPANPFALARPAAQGALAQTDQQRAIAEVQAAMVVARANPRDQIVAMDRILNACTRPTLAKASLYSYARGGQEITGPSIRLAEAMAQAWGNMSFGIREIEQRNAESTVQAYAWDVETNTRREMTFQVPHVRHTKSGVKRLTDPRDIYEMVANQGARRLRACILGVIPGDVQEAAVRQCETTLVAIADTSPAGQKKLLQAFERFGVTQEQIEKRIQRRLDTIQPAQVLALEKIYTSLRDDMSKASDWFEVVGASAGTSTTVADIAARAARETKPASGDTNGPTGETKPANGETKTPSGETAGPGPTYAQVRDSLEKAKTLDELDDVASLIADIGGGKAQQKELNDLYGARRAALEG